MVSEQPAAAADKTFGTDSEEVGLDPRCTLPRVVGRLVTDLGDGCTPEAHVQMCASREVPRCTVCRFDSGRMEIVEGLEIPWDGTWATTLSTRCFLCRVSGDTRPSCGDSSGVEVTVTPDAGCRNWLRKHSLNLI